MKIPQEKEEAIRAQARHCYQCGVCMGSCPVARVNEGFHPRRLVREISMGDWEEILRGDAIWLCAQCHLCSALCPQGVGLSELIVGLRNIATEMGINPPEAYIENMRQISETGRLAQMSAPVARRRQKLNLDALEPAAADEIRKLVEGTKFSRLLSEGE